MSDLSDAIDAEALKPQTVSNDGVTVSRRSLTELSEYEKHQTAKTATADMAATFRGMTFKVVPPGGR